jgi:SNF2 family DNA or RNA helicase
MILQHQECDFERFKDSNAIAIFWEQGLGKSKISLELAKYRYKKGDIESLLVIAPNNVHVQWAEEQVPLWLSDIEYEVMIIGGTRGVKNTSPFKKKGALHIVCCNIDTFSTADRWKEVAEFVNNTKSMVVLDEATVIKSIKALRTERVLYSFNTVKKFRRIITSNVLNTVCRVILTGTPVTNGPFDLWTMFEFISPNYFGRNYYSFKQRYCISHKIMITVASGLKELDVPVDKDIWTKVKNCTLEAAQMYGVREDVWQTIQEQTEFVGAYRNLDELKEKIAPISSFRKLEDCVDMPGQVMNQRKLIMSPAQQKAYKELEKEFLTEYAGYQVDAKTKIVVYLRLQQVASGFVSGKKYSEDEDIVPSNEVVWIGTSNPKLDALYMDVENAVPLSPCIIVCRFSCEAARIYEDLLQKGYRVTLQTGWKKVGTIEEFQEGKYDCMVANIRVISRGFNLQNSHNMMFYSNTFSLEDRLQTESRIYRLGQKNKCSYIDYVMQDTIDETTIEALLQKKSLLDYIRDSSVKDIVQGRKI